MKKMFLCFALFIGGGILSSSNTPDPCDCTAYFDDIGGHHYCAAGLYFNPQTGSCDWPENVDCNTDDCGGDVNFHKDYWHPNSTIESNFNKLTPSNPATSSATCANGSISVNGKSISVGANGCTSSTYMVTITHYECKYDWQSPECPQKEEYTMYAW